MARQTWDQQLWRDMARFRIAYWTSAKSLLALPDLKFGDRVVQDSFVVTKWARRSNSRFNQVEGTLCEEEERETKGT